MKTIEETIREYNREILALKTSHNVASTLKTYLGIFSYVAGTDENIHLYEITYEDGTNPIMTWTAWADNSRTGDLVLTVPQNNKQILYDIRPTHDEDDEFALFSTRTISSVRRIQ